MRQFLGERCFRGRSLTKSCICSKLGEVIHTYRFNLPKISRATISQLISWLLPERRRSHLG